MKKNSHPISFLAAVLFVGFLNPVPPSQAAPVTNSLSPWNSYMEAFTNGGSSYWFGDSWGNNPPGLKAVISGTFSNRLALHPNFNAYNASHPIWGSKTAILHANCYQEVDYARLQNPAVFSGTIHSNTLTAAHKVKAFIKVFDSNWNLLNSDTYLSPELPVTNIGTAFSISQDLTAYATAGSKVQYGFVVVGRNASPDEETSLGKADVTVTNIPTTLANPKIRITVAGIVSTNNQTNRLIGPVINNNNSYLVTLENLGEQSLIISNTTVSNTSGSSFSIPSGLTNISIAGNGIRSFTLNALPTNSTSIQGALIVSSSDPTAPSVKVNLNATPVSLTDSFTIGTPAQLGWTNYGFFSSNSVWPTDNPSTLSVDPAGSGTLKLTINESVGGIALPWRYRAEKAFVSPGPLDLAGSSLSVSLKASGSWTNTNKVQVFLESLNASGQATGRRFLGTPVDETTTNASPGSGGYFAPDGTPDRVAIVLPEGGSFTTVMSTLAAASDETFDRFAPAFRVVVEATDFEFHGGDITNTVEVDSLSLALATESVRFEVANAGFEADPATNGRAFVPTGWLQWGRNADEASIGVPGANKVLMASGASVYDQSIGSNNVNVLFAPRTGNRALKLYGQYDFVTNIPAGNTNYVWQNDWGAQKGIVYQEWNLAAAGLKPGDPIHAQIAVKVHSVDTLTGGNTFNFGFRYLKGTTLIPSNEAPLSDVTSLTASNTVTNLWRVLTANGNIPADATAVQLVAEFVQTDGTHHGSVYLDDASVGMGHIDPSSAVSSSYTLVWADEFDGTALNPNNWTAETGGGGWGNSEQQTYTTNSANLRVNNGSLILQAVKSGSTWTSARIKSQEKRSFKYGKIEFRAKLPSGVGPWPAAWLLGTNISTVNWPACGEIDVMEWRGNPTNDATTVSHALHSTARNGLPGNSPVEPLSRTAVSNPSTEFHTYAVLWTSNNLVFSVDGLDKATLTPPAGDEATFQKEFFILLNLAMGGSYVGNTISASLTNAIYEVDYVRVYQDPATLSAPSDTTAPVFTLYGANPASVNWGATYADAGATAFDLGDNASVAVITNNPVNSSVPGVYLVTYTATDSKSNSATTNRTVNVTMANGGTNRGADGLTDVLRYAFGGTGTNLIANTLLPSNTVSGGNLVLTYYARTNGNVSLTPVVSTDLANSNSWTNSGVTVSTVSTVTTNGTTLEKRQASTPVSGNKKFLRLKATYTP